jgi:Cdc6-like AAA superfamily ATPase
MVAKSSLKSVLATAVKPNTVPHLIIEARAGTGKTTTMIEGLKFIKGLPTSSLGVNEALKLRSIDQDGCFQQVDC